MEKHQRRAATRSRYLYKCRYDCPEDRGLFINAIALRKHMMTIHQIFRKYLISTYSQYAVSLMC